MNLHNSPSEINACCPNGITRSHRRCEVVFGRLLRHGSQNILYSTRDVLLAPGEVYAYTVDHQAVLNGQDGVTIKVDSTGTGRFANTMHGKATITTNRPL